MVNVLEINSLVYRESKAVTKTIEINKIHPRTLPGGSSFSSYTKIPYARPPLGHLRFQLPERAGPWSGVLDAGKACPKPIQNNYVTGIFFSMSDRPIVHCKQLH